MNWFLACVWLTATSPFQEPSAWRRPAPNWSAKGHLEVVADHVDGRRQVRFFCNSSMAWLAIVRL
jgi:hypothetical protein